MTTAGKIRELSIGKSTQEVKYLSHICGKDEFLSVECSEDSIPLQSRHTNKKMIMLCEKPHSIACTVRFVLKLIRM